MEKRNEEKSEQIKKLLDFLSMEIGTSQISRTTAKNQSRCCKCGGDASVFKDELSKKNINSLAGVKLAKMIFLEDNMKRFRYSVHNLFGHPIMEICNIFGAKKLGSWFHDVTLPKDP